MTLGGLLFELLSEALGLHSETLKSMDCMKALNVLGHYYPPCPQPDLTFGTSQHSDSSFITILLQDQIGGLQILHKDSWVDVSPIPGALVINIGDYLQIITNDKFISVEHRGACKQSWTEDFCRGLFQHKYASQFNGLRTNQRASL
ncbi:1-aminocyclopropane-1-carboxylate oxidase-like protein 11 [Raphanus sativus]|nr:1-aminocyclopropane-1-carboxylate oxidase-like protein 11 [Raphanus sativus]